MLPCERPYGMCEVFIMCIFASFYLTLKHVMLSNRGFSNFLNRLFTYFMYVNTLPQSLDIPVEGIESPIKMVVSHYLIAAN